MLVLLLCQKMILLRYSLELLRSMANWRAAGGYIERLNRWMFMVSGFLFASRKTAATVAVNNVAARPTTSK